jgi:7-cyano-7-deazaguanine synthase
MTDTNNQVVVIMSGGLDSTTLLYDLLEGGYAPFALSFNYGQRHSKELNYAKNTCRKLGVEHRTLNLAVSGLTELIATSALTSKPLPIPMQPIGSTQPVGGDDTTWGKIDPIPVPEGHYAEDNMKLTVVPNRNMIMLSMASAVAVSRKAAGVAIGVHAGDHAVYPDCRPSFIEDSEYAIMSGNEGFIDPNFRLMAPYVHKTKEWIAYRALELNVPLHETWSCYKGDSWHCGKCGTCVERLEAIDHAQRSWELRHNDEVAPIDATQYSDKDFWRAAVSGR